MCVACTAFRPVVASGRTKWTVLGILLNWLLLVSILVGQVLSVIDGTGTLVTLQIPKKGKNMKGIGDISSAAHFLSSCGACTLSMVWHTACFYFPIKYLTSSSL